MKTVLKILAGVIVLAVVAIVGWRYYQIHRARQAGLLTENIAHDGNLWKADFTARIPAPEQTVFAAIRDIEKTHNDQIKMVRVVSQSGNKKTVDIDIAAPGGQTITTELVFEYLPEQKKIIYHTVDNPLLDTQAVYQFGDEGASTFIDYHETTHLLHSRHLRRPARILEAHPQHQDRRRGQLRRRRALTATAVCAPVASSAPAQPQLNMIRFTAEFLSSAFALDGCPRWKRAEVALAGRSNVGKSSLLNALAGVKGLARTSKTPGRTRCLNFFAVGNTLALCDLPGFGYAKMSHEDAAKIASMMHEYIHGRVNLAAIAILIDCRRGPQQDELDLAAMAAERGIEVIPVATKCDKLRRSQRAAALKRFDSMRARPIFCSATSGEGIDDLRRRILAVDRSDSAKHAGSR
jgi:GTP-binding protein